MYDTVKTVRDVILENGICQRMGKSKRRIFNKCKYLYHMSMRREDAIFGVVRNLKYNKFDPKTRDIITMFGLSAEELSEAGASYEELRVLRGVLD